MKPVKIKLWTIKIERPGKSPRYVNPCSHVDKRGLESYSRLYNMIHKPNVARVIPHEERKQS